MTKEELFKIWARLATATCMAWLFGLMLTVLQNIDGWRVAQTGWETFFQIAIEALLAILAGVLTGTVVMVLLLPFLLRGDRGSGREATIQFVADAAGIFCAGLLIQASAYWAVAVNILDESSIAEVPKGRWAIGCVLAGVLFALIWRLLGRAATLEARLNTIFTGPISRRRVLAVGVGAAALSSVGALTIAKVMPRPRIRSAERPRGPSVILVTFDAMSAADLSAFGYHLPTSPNLEAFARSASVFDQYYSSATFTTPSVASFLTGRYPLNLNVFELSSRLRSADATRTLTSEMRAAGYETAASVGNPWAYPIRLGIGSDFDHIGSLPMLYWKIPALLLRIPRSMIFADVDQYSSKVERVFEGGLNLARTKSPPALSFRQAEDLLQTMAGKPFFLWVHVMAPHEPYLPDEPYLGRFTADPAVRELLSDLGQPTSEYPPERQPQIDAYRLRYNEWICQADAAFGQFMQRAEEMGALRDTVVVVSADHGQSHKNGWWGHGGDSQEMPILHVPLMVRQPGQKEGKRIAAVADHTSMAPTILDLVGLPRPGWMEGASLRTYIEAAGDSAGQGYAYSFSLTRNRTLDRIDTGSAGIIDGSYRYRFDIDNRTGLLQTVAGAYRGESDLSADRPALASVLRKRILARFPALPQDPA